MIRNEYNGWTNYETWDAAMWLEGLNDIAQDIYDNVESDDTFSRDEVATFTMSEYLEEYVDEQIPDIESGLFADILNAGLSEINYHEIASNYIYEVEKDENGENEE